MIKQVEIEEKFSKEAVKEAIDCAVSPIHQLLPEEYYYKVTEMFVDPYDVINRTLIALGNQDIGPQNDDGDIVIGIKELYQMIQPIAGEKTVQFLELTEGILFDIKYRSVQDEFGQWYKHKAAFINLPDTSMYAHLQEFALHPLPMKEEPERWNEKQRGGYFLEKKKVTMNLGEEHQPQQVLDVLNTLQLQSWGMHNSSETEYRNFLRDKFSAKADLDLKGKEEVDKKVSNVISGFGLTLSCMEEFQMYEFHFVYRYDFRGRIYNVGHNLHIQGDKFKKGMLFPIIKD